MNGTLPFRFVLPIVQAISAIVFGGIGLHQRHQILSQTVFGAQSLWESTARFHVWPLSYRFAFVTNAPAFLAAEITSFPLERLSPNVAETSGFVIALLGVIVLWYSIGRSLDSRQTHVTFQPWGLFMLFTALGILGIFTPGYIGYIYYGILLWISFTVGIVCMSRRPNVSQPDC